METHDFELQPLQHDNEQNRQLLHPRDGPSGRRGYPREARRKDGQILCQKGRSAG
jgi:hypothetical protein